MSLKHASDLGFLEWKENLLGMLISAGIPASLPTKDKDSVNSHAHGGIPFHGPQGLCSLGCGRRGGRG